jgi:hypothetical protein
VRQVADEVPGLFEDRTIPVPNVKGDSYGRSIT